jgi:DNA-binding IclR family transcriptional regulator
MTQDESLDALLMWLYERLPKGEFKPVGNHILCTVTELHHSTVARLMRTLDAEGFLTHIHADGEYYICMH